MQELEKILEELKAHRSFASECGNFNVAAAFELCVEIIRKHMNGGQCGECSRRKWYQKGYEDGKKSNYGWIPVEYRLPTSKECENDEGDFWVTIWNEFKQCKPYTSKACFNETTNEFDLSEKDYTPFAEIIAWRPLPEPYRKDGD